jgi:hypothetical protein
VYFLTAILWAWRGWSNVFKFLKRENYEWKAFPHCTLCSHSIC